jgi:HPt (histidine-containing phosphotransfer) domain-containing protein
MNVKIDKLHLLTLVGEDNVAIRIILEEFLENGLELLQKMCNAVSCCDEELVREALHQLKGASGMFGMQSLYEACVELETCPMSELSGHSMIKLREVLVKSHQLAAAAVVVG